MPAMFDDVATQMRFFDVSHIALQYPKRKDAWSLNTLLAEH